MNAADEATVLQLRQVEHAIQSTFGGLFQPTLPREMLLTRGLAAYAVQILADEEPDVAAGCVIDGFGDYGIDAVYVDVAAGRLVLAQSKWRLNPQRTITVGETLKFTHGVEALMNEQYERFGGRLDELAPQISSVINRHGAQVDLVVVTNSVKDLSSEVLRALDETCGHYNSPPDDVPLRTRVLGLEDVHTHVLNAASGSTIELTASLQGWGRVDWPYPSYYGCISVSQLADWYHMHRDRLFDRNVRRALGLTKVNRQLIATLRDEAEHFWYFNNGITVLCAEIGRAPAGAAQRERAELTMIGVSVVNGAQTVASIAAARERSPECLERAKVLIKVISLKDCPDSFATALTRANNTQNLVVDRDFIALDERQLDLKRDFALTLRKTYAIKRGEPTPSPDEGCTVDEAALALAYAHPDIRFAVYAHGNPGTLRDPASQRYAELFHDRRLKAVGVWRLVRAVRRVGQVIAATTASTEGREHVVVKQCAELTAHLVLRRLRLEAIDELSTDWDEELDRIGTLAPQVIGLIIDHMERTFDSYHVPTFCKSVTRSRELAELVGADLAAGKAPAPRAPAGSGDLHDDGLVYHLARRGIEARGRLDGHGFVVESGSTAAASAVASFAQNRSAHSRREWLIRQGVLRPMKGDAARLVLIQDQYFDTPSQAAAVLLGASMNGRTVWCTAEGFSLNRAQARLRAARDKPLSGD